MFLTKEIENIKNKVTNNSKNVFPIIDKSTNSYYINYSDSIHQKESCCEYCSDFLEFKKELIELWSESDNKIFYNDVLSSIMQVRDDEESIIEAIQLYNYMM